MGAPKDHKQKSTRWPRGIDLAIFAAVMLFATYSWRNLRPAPPARLTAPMPTLARGPASLPATAPPPERSTHVFALGCLAPHPVKVRTQASLLRLDAELCQEARHVIGRNETTGENLLLFPRDKKISSHYFPLKAGKNLIRIEWSEAKMHRNGLTVEVERSL